ncbi:MAG: membrane protein insertase YidC [Desulfovibrionaceae bacterium]|nr:membrane protein insertase YidC [Desulfovibrionaceae bacterium]
MDNTRLIVALGVSLLILFGWQYVFPPAKPVQTQAVEATDQARPGPDQAPAQAVEAEAVKPTPGRRIRVETPLYSALINTQGGVLEGFVLKRYKQTIQPDSANIDMVGQTARAKAPLGILLNGVPTWRSGAWAFDGQDEIRLGPEETKTLVFTGEAAGYRVQRSLSLRGDSYLLEETAAVSSLGQAAGEVRLAFTGATESLSAEDNRYNPTRVAYLGPGGLEEESDRDDLRDKGVTFSGRVRWGAIDSNYFIQAIAPAAEQVVFKAGMQDNVFRMAVEQTAAVTPAGPTAFKCAYFIGPCERDLLAQAPGDLKAAVDFGWFDFLAKPLLWVVDWCYKHVAGNYGVAIIILTIIIKIIFWPLSEKSYKSMEQMKRLQPHIQKLKEKYKDDKQRLNQETMALYKTYKINPAGGCVPMFVQIPVFFGLYKALLGAIELRHAPFISHLPFTDKIWLADLSAKDPFYVTPILMGVTMFLQQRMTPTTGDSMQNKIMYLLPVIFTFLFLSFPAGLVIYWMVNNILSIAQQWWMIQRGKKRA